MSTKTDIIKKLSSLAPGEMCTLGGKTFSCKELAEPLAIWSDGFVGNKRKYKDGDPKIVDETNKNVPCVNCVFGEGWVCEKMKACMARYRKDRKSVVFVAPKIKQKRSRKSAQ